MYISLANSRARGFRKWSDAIRPVNDDDDNSGGATPIAIAEPPEDDAAIKEPPHQPWAVPGVGTSL
jgi:hypothetical protein